MAKRTRQEQGEESKKLGRVAQKKFDGWCTPADLTANQSIEDDEGWDFFIQAKSSNEPRPFLDQKAPAFSALVQVKGTSDPSGRFRMTLSNALKLVVDHLGPAFVFVAHVEQDEVRTAWLVHCGNEFMDTVLKAATEKTSKPLNKRWLTFRPATEDLVSKESLRSTLEQRIGDLRAYFDWKREAVEAAGYGEARYELRVRYAAASKEDADDALADFAIGLRELPVESVDVFDLRFGNARLQKTIAKPRLSRPLVPSEPNTDIIVEGANGERIQVACQGYLASAYVPFLSESSNRLRLVAPYLEFLLARAPGTEDTAMLRWSTPGIHSPVASTNLDDKARAATILRLVRQPGTKVTLRTAAGVLLSVPLGGEFVLGDERATQYLKVLEDYRLVTQRFSIPLAGGEVLPETLIRVARQLNVLASIADSREISAEVRFPKREPPPGVELGDHVSFVTALLLGFPDTKLVVVTAVSGKVENCDDTFFWVRPTRLPLLGCRLLSRPTLDAVKEQLQKGALVLESLGATKVFIRPIERLPRSWLRDRDDGPSIKKRRRLPRSSSG